MRAMDGQAATTGSGDVSAPREPTSPLWREDDVEAGGRREPDGERTARRSAAPESPPARRDGDAAATPAAGPGSSLGVRSYYDLRARSSLGTFRDLIRRQASADDDGTGDTVSRSYRLPSVLLRMPNTAFGMPMGLAAHAIMWRSLGRADRLDSLGGRDGVLSVGRLCWYSACVTGGTAAALYGYKIVTSFSLVRAEYLNEVRCHFFNAPNLIFIMLLLGVPDDVEVSDGALRALWGCSFCYHVILTSNIYKMWMFSKRRNFTAAKPQFLMSTVGWFLLSNLGQTARLEQTWGIGLPTLCFGAGFVLYFDLVIFIFGKLHENRGMKGSPAMFLLIAPPSVAVVSLDLMDGDDGAFPDSAEMMLGWALVLLVLLIRLGPSIYKTPSVLGEYWAYVFPLAAAATATIRYAGALNSDATVGLAAVVIVLAIAALLIVLFRMALHIYLVFKGDQQWRDPLFKIEMYHC